MARHLTHAAFTRQLTQRWNEHQSRVHRTITEFQKLGRVPKHYPTTFRNPLEVILIEQAVHQVPKCGCLRLSCRICGLVAFHARLRSVERPYLQGPMP